MLAHGGQKSTPYPVLLPDRILCGQTAWNLKEKTEGSGVQNAVLTGVRREEKARSDASGGGVNDSVEEKTRG